MALEIWISQKLGRQPHQGCYIKRSFRTLIVHQHIHGTWLDCLLPRYAALPKTRTNTKTVLTDPIKCRHVDIFLPNPFLTVASEQIIWTLSFLVFRPVCLMLRACLRNWRIAAFIGCGAQGNNTTATATLDVWSNFMHLEKKKKWKALKRPTRRVV